MKLSVQADSVSIRTKTRKEAMKKRTFRAAATSAILMGALSVGVLSAPAAFATETSSIQAVIPAATYSDSYAKQIHDLINAERVKVGSRPFVWNQKIADVSQDWANKLGVATKAANWDFGTIHRTDAGGSLIPAGATWYRENIGFNGTPQQIVSWWMNSPGHKAAMLDPKGTDAGIGYVYQTSGPYAGLNLVVSNMAAYSTTSIPAIPTVVAGTQYKTTIQLNMRSGGGFEYSVIGYGNAGTIVTATGKTNGIWYEVKMGSQTGWMSSEYLTLYAAPSTGTISYAGHVQDIGWQSSVSNGATAGSVGLGLRLESLRFTTSGQTARAHVQNIGWQDYQSGASTIGTSGQSLRMEAVQVKSNVAGEAIRCQAHVENVGWMPEVGDGEVCGTSGLGLRLEAVRFRIVTR